MNKKEKKQLTTIIITSIIITITIITILKTTQHQQKIIPYKGIKFTETKLKGETIWTAEFTYKNKKRIMPFRKHPKDVENITMDKTAINKIKNAKKIYLTMDPDAPSKTVIAGIEIVKITGEKHDYLNIPTKGALTKPTGKAPTITCENATNTTTVIWIRNNTNTDIKTINNCIIIEGNTPEEQIKAADKLTYSLIGIIT